MEKEFELNNIQYDASYDTSKIKKDSPVFEVFNAWVTNNRYGALSDKQIRASKKYICNLGAKAGQGDGQAVAELNTLRRLAIEEETLKSIELLGTVFGTFAALGFNETVERVVRKFVGENAREQAANGDVVFPSVYEERYIVPTFLISAGYEVDYRRVSLGDMSLERRGIEQVKTAMLNMAKVKIVKIVTDAIRNAKGVRYQLEVAGLTKAGLDGIITKMRPHGRLSLVGDYALVSQLNGFAGYTATINSNTVLGISEKIMNEIHDTGYISAYNGVVVAEMENPYDTTKINAEGGFDTMIPRGIGWLLPTGVNSPVMTWTRGGITTMSGNDVKTGKIITRFDLEVACDVAKGLEYRIGQIIDTSLGGL